MNKVLTGIGVIGLVVFGGYWLLNGNVSREQQYSECSVNAGQIYDANRRTITKNENGYTPNEQAYYYQQTEKMYTSDLEACRDLYGS